jgi:hypothetical protein
MSMDPASFTVEDVIVHDVPPNDGQRTAEQAVTLSEAAIPDLDASRRNYFGEKITGSLAGKAFAVTRDPDQPSNVPDQIASILGDTAQLVAASQEMARTLYAVQSQVNNPGLLTVIVGSASSERWIGVLKLQRHEGIQMRQITTESGDKTFSATILDDLTLTDQTRVFKASLFRGEEPAAHALEGLVSDEQRGYDPRREVANFFLARFLGCKLKAEPEVSTKAFFDGSREYFAKVPDAERQRNYNTALVAELLSPAETLVPTDFAQRFLQSEDRQGYLDHLAERDLREEAIDKDIKLIQPKLNRLTMRTAHNIRVVGPAEQIHDRVTIEQTEAEEVGRIVIRDRFTGFQS